MEKEKLESENSELENSELENSELEKGNAVKGNAVKGNAVKGNAVKGNAVKGKLIEKVKNKNINFLELYKKISIFTVFVPGILIVKYLPNEKLFWNSFNKSILSNKIKYINESVLNTLSSGKKGVIIVSNHINFTDATLILSKINSYVIVKSDLLKTEFRHLDVITDAFNSGLKFIPYIRGNKEDGENTKRKILNVINNNNNVLLFPEGTSQASSKNILPFKKGIFHLAFENNIRIFPIVINYKSDNYGVDKVTRFNLSHILNNKDDIHIKFNSLVYPKKYKSVEELIEYVHNNMSDTLASLQKY